MPTASAGVHGRGWQYYSAVAAKPRPLPRHVDLSGRRPFSASAAKPSKPPPSWQARAETAATLSWQEWLHLLRRYVQREGHARVPLEHIEQSKRLGAWLSQQWAHHQAKRLSHERTVRLQDAGVDWSGPAPPASGVIGPKYLNERKWDANRAEHLAALRGVPRAFDSSPKPASEPHWPEYSADNDPHTRAWRERRRARAESNGFGYESAVSDPWLLPGSRRVKGLPSELGRRLQAAKEEIQSVRRDRAHPHPHGKGA
jgi:hypothetical protein